MIRAAFLTLAVSVVTPALAADLLTLPMQDVTPGDIDPSATTVVICAHDTKSRRRVSSATRAAVLGAYGVRGADRIGYELDHLIPLALGGSNAPANLWPQPEDEAALKDVLEVEMQRLVCHGLLPLDQAQREIADDWTAAYRRYVGGSR